MPTILLAFQPHELTPAHLDQIQSHAPHMNLIVTQDRARIEALLPGIEIAVCSFPHDLLARAPKLHWFQNWGAGVDWLRRYPDVQTSDLIVTNMSGVHAIPISEHILAFLLSFGRGLPEQMRNQTQHKWAWPRHPRPFELAGKTMLLIGVGAIGERTAQSAAALGIHVMGLRRHPQVGAAGVAEMVGPDALHDVLPRADFVVITAPLTEETRGLIGEAELRLMPPNTYLVNIGRGEIIDEPALIRALQEGRIGGAGLDVTTREPLPADSPLWEMPNVIITAHYAGFTTSYTERAMEIFLHNLSAYLAGEPMRNVVDKQLGY
ncbi:MAG: D-2-hydroxyacid dehydrogenase [Caldilineaceae bacterium]